MATTSARWKNGENHLDHAPVAFFWDLENVCVPKKADVRAIVEYLRRKFAENHSEKHFIVVCNVRGVPASITDRLNNSNVEVVHVEASRKNAADVSISMKIQNFTEEVARWSYNGPDRPRVVLISSDVHFKRDLHRLKHQKNYETILIHNDGITHELLDYADTHYNFRELVERIPIIPRTDHEPELVVDSSGTAHYRYKFVLRVQGYGAARKDKLEVCMLQFGGKVLTFAPHGFAKVGFRDMNEADSALHRIRAVFLEGRRLTANWESGGPSKVGSVGSAGASSTSVRKVTQDATTRSKKARPKVEATAGQGSNRTPNPPISKSNTCIRSASAAGPKTSSFSPGPSVQSLGRNLSSLSLNEMAADRTPSKHERPKDGQALVLRAGSTSNSMDILLTLKKGPLRDMNFTLEENAGEITLVSHNLSLDEVSFVYDVADMSGVNGIDVSVELIRDSPVQRNGASIMSGICLKTFGDDLGKEGVDVCILLSGIAVQAVEKRLIARNIPAFCSIRRNIKAPLIPPKVFCTTRNVFFRRYLLEGNFDLWAKDPSRIFIEVGAEDAAKMDCQIASIMVHAKQLAGKGCEIVIVAAHIVPEGFCDSLSSFFGISVCKRMDCQIAENMGIEYDGKPLSYQPGDEVLMQEFAGRLMSLKRPSGSLFRAIGILPILADCVRAAEIIAAANIADAAVLGDGFAPNNSAEIFLTTDGQAALALLENVTDIVLVPLSTRARYIGASCVYEVVPMEEGVKRAIRHAAECSSAVLPVFVELNIATCNSVAMKTHTAVDKGVIECARLGLLTLTEYSALSGLTPPSDVDGSLAKDSERRRLLLKYRLPLAPVLAQFVGDISCQGRMSEQFLQFFCLLEASQRLALSSDRPTSASSHVGVPVLKEDLNHDLLLVLATIHGLNTAVVFLARNIYTDMCQVLALNGPPPQGFGANDHHLHASWISAGGLDLCNVRGSTWTLTDSSDSLHSASRRNSLDDVGSESSWTAVTVVISPDGTGSLTSTVIQIVAGKLVIPSLEETKSPVSSRTPVSSPAKSGRTIFPQKTSSSAGVRALVPLAAMPVGTISARKTSSPAIVGTPVQSPAKSGSTISPRKNPSSAGVRELVSLAARPVGTISALKTSNPAIVGTPVQSLVKPVSMISSPTAHGLLYVINHQDPSRSGLIHEFSRNRVLITNYGQNPLTVEAMKYLLKDFKDLVIIEDVSSKYSNMVGPFRPLQAYDVTFFSLESAKHLYEKGLGDDIKVAPSSVKSRGKKQGILRVDVDEWRKSLVGCGTLQSSPSSPARLRTIQRASDGSGSLRVGFDGQIVYLSSSDRETYPDILALQHAFSRHFSHIGRLQNITLLEAPLLAPDIRKALVDRRGNRYEVQGGGFCALLSDMDEGPTASCAVRNSKSFAICMPVPSVSVCDASEVFFVADCLVDEVEKKLLVKPVSASPIAGYWKYVCTPRRPQDRELQRFSRKHLVKDVIHEGLPSSQVEDITHWLSKWSPWGIDAKFVEVRWRKLWVCEGMKDSLPCLNSPPFRCSRLPLQIPGGWEFLPVIVKRLGLVYGFTFAKLPMQSVIVGLDLTFEQSRSNSAYVYGPRDVLPVAKMQVEKELESLASAPFTGGADASNRCDFCSAFVNDYDSHHLKSCDHLFCRFCLAFFVVWQSRNPTYFCWKCQVPLDVDDLRAAMDTVKGDKPAIARIEAQLAEWAGAGRSVPCPTFGCSRLIPMDDVNTRHGAPSDDRDRHVRCMECRNWICRTCLDFEHENRPCNRVSPSISRGMCNSSTGSKQ